MTSILRRVSQEYASLTRQQKQVATFLLRNPNDIAFYTLETTAAKADVSTTTVLRFARRMGYEGFTDFQRQVQREMKERNRSLPDKFSRAYSSVPREELLLNTFSNDVNNINRTMMEMPLDLLRGSIEMITKAQHVYILGLRESHALAHYLFTRLIALRPRVALPCFGEAEMPEQFLSIQPEDVCVFFLFTRYTRKSIEILTELRRSQVPVILVTTPSHDELNGLADIILPCYVDGISLKNSSAAPISLINYIANAVADFDYEKSMRYLAESEDILVRNNIIC